MWTLARVVGDIKQINRSAANGQNSAPPSGLVARSSWPCEVCWCKWGDQQESAILNVAASARIYFRLLVGKGFATAILGRGRLSRHASASLSHTPERMRPTSRCVFGKTRDRTVVRSGSIPLESRAGRRGVSCMTGHGLAGHVSTWQPHPAKRFSYLVH